MFSEIDNQQTTHNAPYFSNFRPGETPISSTYSPSSSRHPWFSTGHNATFRQRLEKPQQYAHSLRNVVSPPQQSPNQSSHTPLSTPETFEHMLRRKTPNGTLAAGYDGSPVEWTKRPHVVKTNLMPRSNENSHALYPPSNDEVAERPLLCKDYSIDSRSCERLGPTPHHVYVKIDGYFNDRLKIDSNQSNVGWRCSGALQTGLDSVLHQSPLHHQHYSLLSGQHVPTALQPMWPPCLGPLSINHPGSHRPYWSDSICRPNHPAPFRDPRFPCQKVCDRDMSAQLQPAIDNYGQWLQANGNAQYPYFLNQAVTTGSFYEHQEDNNVPPDVVSKPPNKNSIVSHRQFVAKPDQQHDIPLAYRNKPSQNTIQDAQIVYDIQDNTRSTSKSLSIPYLAQLQNSASSTNNPHFKHKILFWAHRIYNSLVVSIEQTRRTSLNEQHNHGPEYQPALYTQSPRRPYPSWSNSQRNCDQLNHRQVMPRQLTNTLSYNAQNPQFPKTYTSGSSFADTVPTPFLSPCPLTLYSHQDRELWQTCDPSSRYNPFTASLSQLPHHLTAEQRVGSASVAARHAMEILDRLCEESKWQWTDGILLNGCLAYGLADYARAMGYYTQVLRADSGHVEAMSNLAASLLALNRRDDAEQYWSRAVKLRPNYFEAIEHLIGLLHESHRGREAIRVIEYVERALRLEDGVGKHEQSGGPTLSTQQLSSGSLNPITINISGSSGYAIPPSDNGRLLALIHGKGNMLYQLGDNSGAAIAFEDAILIGAGNRHLGIHGLIEKIMGAYSEVSNSGLADYDEHCGAGVPMLLSPEQALETSKLVFPSRGRLPGLQKVPDGSLRKAAISIVSNSLLSLAKIYQDGMSSSGAAATAPRATSGVQEILALYYLSLSLQPSPSTANNVGILLASIQQPSRSRLDAKASKPHHSAIPGVTPGSGIALALAYYDYGLTLDSRHAHLYTNLGSLFKDIGQLNAAIKMYEKAVSCDGSFDIALANLANAVKDQGKVSDAITYYRRAVASNPDFAEAVCGLANALNSVCSWTGRGGISQLGSPRDRWHVDERGILYDSKCSTKGCGWIERVVAIVEKQLYDGENWGKGVINSFGVEQMLKQFGISDTLRHDSSELWTSLWKALEGWAESQWEGARVVRLIERATKNLGWQIFRHQYVNANSTATFTRIRPQLPAVLAIPSAPTVLPFHTFTCPLSAKQIRKISQRNGLRVSCSTLRAPWLPAEIYNPPAPPNPHLNVGYISSDFNNHPLAHLMQSVFGFHNPNRVKAFCYATTTSDGSVHREQIEREAPVFYDASSWSTDRLVNQVVSDGIHILINLNGYTRGAKNEVFAARPAPVQMSFMGFAGTLGAEWCDYLLADATAVPPQTLRPWRGNVDLLDQTKDGNNDDDQDEWIYGENIIFTKDTFFCCDHRQSAPDSQETQLSWLEEQRRRWKMRKDLFPNLPDDTVIFGNFNQLYKVSDKCYISWTYVL